MTDTKPTLEEQIAYQSTTSKTFAYTGQPKDAAIITALQSALQVAQQEYTDCQATLKDERYCHGETIASLKRTASEQIQAAHKRAEKAEADNKRLVELLKKPTEAMVDVGVTVYDHDYPIDEHVTIIFTAMSDELLREHGGEIIRAAEEILKEKNSGHI